jgi:hypothetical protein
MKENVRAAIGVFKLVNTAESPLTLTQEKQ